MLLATEKHWGKQQFPYILVSFNEPPKIKKAAKTHSRSPFIERDGKKLIT